MVFDTVTLFEVHLDGAQFGPATTADRDDEDRLKRPAAPRRDSDSSSGKPRHVTAVEPPAESADDGGSGLGRFAKFAVVGVVLSVVAALVVKRLASRGDPDFDVESPDTVENEPYTSGEGGPVAGPSTARDE